MTNLVVLLCVLAAATAAGTLLRARSGRLRPARRGAGPGSDPYPADGASAALASLGVRAGDSPVTLLQFSSAFCAPCRATRVVLSEVAAGVPGVRHVEVDAESHLEAVRALGILRTPTTLIVDGSGQVVRRAGGVPRRADVLAAVSALTGDVSCGETA